MGFGFPTGMRLVSAINTGPMPWFWGVNGAAGVLAASVALVTSIAFSIDTTLRIGAACYLLVAAPAVLLMFARARSNHTALRPCTHPQARMFRINMVGSPEGPGNIEVTVGAAGAWRIDRAWSRFPEMLAV